MENVGGQVAFYRYLMARNISKFDWDNEKPVSVYQSQMIEMSMDMEFIFIRDSILTTAFMKSPRSVISLTCAEMFDEFNTWVERGKTNYKVDIRAFGQKISKVVPDEEPGQLAAVISKDMLHIDGVSKKRTGAGWLYTFDVDVAMASMIEKKWFGLASVPLRSFAFDA